MKTQITAAQIEQLKKNLLDEKSTLQLQTKNVVKVDADRRDVKEEIPNSGDEALDVDAISTEVYLDEHALQSIRYIDAALKRMETGQYGVCIDCDSAIPYARLEAYPAAARCIKCKTEFEQKS